METKLSTETDEGIYHTVSGKNYFTMSTTSYKHTGTTPYFVTEVTEENFSLEPITDTNVTNPVTIYVERLAAKVTVDVSDALRATADANGRYKITTPLISDNGESPARALADQDLYIELLGWKLNATTKRSNMVKNIVTDEAVWGTKIGSEANGFVWNAPTFQRSYWGKSYNYGLANPESFLNYVNLEETTIVPLGTPAYCPENTNTSEILSANPSAFVTSVLISAKACDANGVGINLVRFNGLLYQEASFFNYVLTALNAQSHLNYWTTTDGTTYTQIDNTFLKFVNTGNGIVKVNFEMPDGVTTVYSKEGDTYTPVSDFTALNAAIESVSSGAIVYEDGLMYYNVPVEHLNNDDIIDNGGTKTVPEGKYGIVRNHHYVVSINKLENIGKGIFNPGEEIIPEEEEDLYYIGADIKILSWKIVNQDVEL